ncbi:sulfatase-like hydrolase/transferase [Pirellulaceae bacterium SH467]
MHPFLILSLRWLLFSLVLLHAGFTVVVAAQPRNVVFILADDLGWRDLGCYGQEKIPTPHIDRLASQGIRFTQHYSGAPVCAPARCTLMTGKHLGHAEVRGNKQARLKYPEFSEGQMPLSESSYTVAMHFQKAGYRTGAFGKWGLGPVGSTGSPERKGFDLFFGYNCQAVAHSFYPSHLWRNQERVPLNAKPIPGNAKQPDGEIRAEDWIGEVYAPDRMLAEAEAFLRVPSDKPFFLYLPFIEPHVAIHPPKERLDAFPKDWDQLVYRGGNGYLPHPRPRAGYAAMVSDLDRYVGRVMAILDEKGIADETLIVFTSDNGPTHPQKGEPAFHVGGADIEFFESAGALRGNKGSVYEGGIRVPMIARLPGVIPANTTCDAATYFPDWFPTLCEATQLSPPTDVDGESFWDALTSPASQWKRSSPMVWVFPEYTGQVALRDGDWKLVRQGLATRKPGPWELYNLPSDPHEQNNVAASHPELVQQLRKSLHESTSPNETFPVNLHIADTANEPGNTSASAKQPIENVVLITLDGLRGEEVFRGADPAYLTKEAGVQNVENLKELFWRETPDERRRVLMPFLWSQWESDQGWIAGDVERDSVVAVSNGLYFSYPGYNELLTGKPDPKVDSNAKKYNLNTTFLEVLQNKPLYRGKVAAFCSWDVFPYIIHDKRSGIPVNAGWTRFTEGDPRTLASLNLISDQLFREFSGVRYDSITMAGALEYVRTHQPRVLFVSLGETDDWAHAGRYDRYLTAAQQNDALIRTLWETCQSMPQYQGKTVFLFTSDHGRGLVRDEWKSHGKTQVGSERVWFGAIGPGLRVHGIDTGNQYVLAQTAATAAAFLGVKLHEESEGVAAPLPICPK